MKYIVSPSAALKEKYIVPSRWGAEFDEEDRIITILLLCIPRVMGINIWYDSDEEPLVNHVTRSGKVYHPTEKDMVKAKDVSKEVTIKENEHAA